MQRHVKMTKTRKEWRITRHRENHTPGFRPNWKQHNHDRRQTWDFSFSASFNPLFWVGLCVLGLIWFL